MKKYKIELRVYEATILENLVRRKMTEVLQSPRHHKLKDFRNALYNILTQLEKITE